MAFVTAGARITGILLCSDGAKERKEWRFECSETKYFYYYGDEKKRNFLKVTMLCPLILLVNVGWK